MEGPTPVSSLLHSATLVMAGIFVFSASGICPSIAIVTCSGVSLFCTCLISGTEKDFKRTIAFSTVVMVGMIWFMALTVSSFSALAVCGFHAAYKSALFCTVGRMLVVSEIYTDKIWTSRGTGTSNFVLPFCFLLGVKNTTYSSAKHGVDAVTWISANTYFIASITVGLSLLIFWSVGVRGMGNRKKTGSLNLSESAQMPLVLTLIIASAGGLGGLFSASSGNFLSSGVSCFCTTLLVTVWLKIRSRSFPAVGSVGMSSGTFSLTLAKYKFVALTAQLGESLFCGLKASSVIASFPVVFAGCVLALLVFLPTFIVSRLPEKFKMSRLLTALY